MNQTPGFGRDDMPAVLSAPPPGDCAQRQRLGRALNRLASELVRVEAPADDITRWADSAERILAEVARHPQRDAATAHRRMWQGEASALDMWDLFDADSVSGLANAIAPGLRFTQDLPVVVASVNCGLAYQGPPGCVHGGVVAWIFDALLSRAQHVNGLFGMTGGLTVRYLAPTPICHELRGEAEVKERQERKAFITGRLIADGKVTAEAEGIFILPRARLAAGSA
jgi:acyl-coenzyme A thioesterase PaaI-like protein